jgi:hypothetical protein
MEPEEENIGMMNILGDNVLLTRDYGDYRVTNGGMQVNPYVDNDYDYGIPSMNNRMYNKDGEFVFPEMLFKVLKKSLPGIHSITVNKIEIKYTYAFVDSLESTPTYLVYVDVRYNWDTSDVLSPEKLGDKINMSFPMIYTDVKFVKFHVNTVKVERRDYEKEFMNIFGKK